VNPTQFGPNEDLSRYPRDLNRDLSLIESVSALSTQHSALVFIPTTEEIYPPGFDDWVEVSGRLTERLEGAHRPGHFRGVTTVCARLFRIIRPHRAYFGQKDAQQLRVIRRMVADIRSAHPEALEGQVEIVPMPTVREPDGLAMSSRNVYLSPEEREAALALPRALALARRLVEEGLTDADAVRGAVRDAVETPRRRVSEPRLELDYVSVSDEQTIEELETIDRTAVILLAARVGKARLIDNTIVVPKGARKPPALLPLIEADAAALPSA
jgi:pantoate--beta-alanine ligase